MILGFISWMPTIDIFTQGMVLLNVSITGMHLPKCSRPTVLLPNFFIYCKASLQHCYLDFFFFLIIFNFTSFSLVTVIYHNSVHAVVFSLTSGMTFWSAGCGEVSVDVIGNPFQSLK